MSKKEENRVSDFTLFAARSTAARRCMHAVWSWLYCCFFVSLVVWVFSLGIEMFYRMFFLDFA